MITKKKARCVAICSFSDNSTINLWAAPNETYDVALCYYGSRENSPYDFTIKYFLHNKDFKFPNFIKLFTNFPELYEYDYYFFIDDDLIINKTDIEKIFFEAKKNKFDLCQPSLSKDSDISWHHLTHKDGKHIENTNFVEIQAFCMSNKFLRRTYPYFFMFESGWGADLAFYNLIVSESYKWKSALIHSVKIKHPLKTPQASVRYPTSERKILEKVWNRRVEFCFNLPAGSGYKNVILKYPQIIKIPLFSKFYLFIRKIYQKIKLS
jgi:hypothetical protein